MTSTHTANIDIFEVMEPTTITAGELRPGMIILDEFDTPDAVVVEKLLVHDYKIGTGRYVIPGNVCFEIRILDTNKIEWVDFRKAHAITVAK